MMLKSSRRRLETPGVIRCLASATLMVGICSFPAFVQADPCVVVDDGTGTVSLPPEGCEYLSPDEVHEIIDGLPAGTTIELEAIHIDFICNKNPGGGGGGGGHCGVPGGGLGGEVENFSSKLQLQMTGTGGLSTFSRTVELDVFCTTLTGPRNPGDPVQDFPTEMFQLQGSLFGDPDFSQFQIVAGSGHGLPSPGHTTLTRLGPPGSDFTVDSFFDITYRIDYEGAPGGPLDGLSGSSVGALEMAAQAAGVPVCQPTADQTACEPNSCPVPGDCVTRCVNYNAATGLTHVLACDCGDPNGCHVVHNADPATPTANPCQVEGPGTVILPPQDCAYLSPAEVHEIINGLPPGTTIELDARHAGFFPNGPPVPGGSLGGEIEDFSSQLTLTMTGTGSLNGFNRLVSIPIQCVTHTAPRSPGDPVQDFDTDMFQLQGQLFGDPDFAQLQITGGTGNGLPSPGHTTLTELAPNFYAVDSFFDIAYRVDFQGAPGSALDGLSGSTTATLRMSTGLAPSCAGSCPPGTTCVETTTLQADGSYDLCCDCVDDTPTCEPLADGSGCTQVDCSTLPGGAAGGNPCVVPDDGSGTVVLPPQGCAYLSPDDVHQIVDGLPPGTMVEFGASHTKFQPMGPPQPGGTLGGQRELFNSLLFVDLVGVGGLPINRSVVVPIQCETHTGPRTPGDDVQTFPTDMFRLQGELFGDPDFCFLRVTGGTDNGLPSPGHTTLTQLPSGDFAVDSFFDIAYRIEYQGCPGSPLDGVVGQTEGTIHMSTGDGSVEICQPSCMTYDPLTGATTVTECDCDPANTCFPTAVAGAAPQCVGDCPPGTVCEETVTTNADGTLNVCCDCVPEVTGACCTTFPPFCEDVSAADCNGLGTYLGDGSTCSGVQVACCLEDGGCIDADETCCVDLHGGTPISGSTCNDNPCAADECEPLPDGSGCSDFECDDPAVEECQPRCVSVDPLTGVVTVTQCDCRPSGDCALPTPPPAGDENPCTVEDDGSGTVQLPPVGCEYLSPNDVHEIIAGLPAGTTIELDPIHANFFNVTTGPGGTLGGEVETFDSTLEFTVSGTGALEGFSRTITVQSACETHTAPRSPGDAVQSFDTDMFRLQGELFGDPDFCQLRITGGTNNGLPSPGHTTLRALPGGNYAVDSFFDIAYRIEFQGCPGSVLQGLGGTTTGSLRMSTGSIPSCEGDCPPGTTCHETTFTLPDGSVDVCCDCVPDPTGACCLMGDPYCVTTTAADCAAQGGSYLGDGSVCTAVVSACCLDDGTCIDAEEGCCVAVHGGTPITGSSCDDVPSPCGPQDCEPLPDGSGCTQFDCNSLPGGAAGPPNPCQVTDNGSGTVTLPPAGCAYLSPDEVHEIVNGLPIGTTIELGASHEKFSSQFPPTPGGSLGGEIEQFNSILILDTDGTGDLAGFSRTLFVPIQCESHTGPRTPGDAVQSFPNDMFRLQGELFGDPDFCTFRVTGGTDFGMPSPGHTTLTRLGPPGSPYTVDSFFDIAYRIEFQGCPGSALDGLSGATTATLKMSTGDGTVDNCQPRCLRFDAATGESTVIDCECQPANTCFPVPSPVAGALPECVADCPPGEDCERSVVDNGDGTFDVCCACVPGPQDCGVNAAGTDCLDVACPDGVSECQPRCIAFDPLTGESTVVECECRLPNECHAEIPPAPGGPSLCPTTGPAGADPCVVTDTGGTVILPPAGCEYLSPDDVHEIVDGLPGGTTIELGPIHQEFLLSDRGPGGNLGGEFEEFDSILVLDICGTGTLGGFQRSLAIPIQCETHTGPRTPGDPIQSFDTDMFRLQGGLVGDPDFDLLTITGGTDNGLPSPGHTTLTLLPSGQFNVDSFFDIAYRIDFVGAPGGALAGLSGSTTRTIRMQTGNTPGCVGDCPPGFVCEQSQTVDPTSGVIQICCDCVQDLPDCTTDDDCIDNDVCTFDQCVAGTCVNTPGLYGDIATQANLCGQDNDVGLFDLFAVLDSFSGTGVCTDAQADIAGQAPTPPCEPDGDNGLFDIFAVLDAFNNSPSCDCSGTPAPTPPAQSEAAARSPQARASAGQVDLSIVPAARVAKAGGDIRFDVFANGKASIRGYQLAFDVSSVADVTIASVAANRDAKGYVFGATESYSAGDTEKGRLANALSVGAVDVSGSVYLGSITLSVPKGARGVIHVTLSQDDSMLLDAERQSVGVSSIAGSSVNIR